MKVRLGTQGWNYADWIGSFYPSGTRATDFLRVYGRAFDTVEVDSTFYAIPPLRSVQSWAERTPPGFVFSLKLPREVTHVKRLRGTRGLLERFCDRVRELGAKLGPILIQLGPDFGPDELASLEAFVPSLPSDLRFAVEFRQPGWVCPEVYELLLRHQVAWALSDGRWMPRSRVLRLAARPTASFTYLRWMGANRALTEYSRVQIDRSQVLDAWAGVLRSSGNDPLEVFGYVNNHFSGHSPATVRDLQKRLGQRPTGPEELTEQTSLF